MKPPRTPKQSARDRATWYPYYAGFSTGFVEDMLEALPLASGSVVVDPWNGTGTTTHLASEFGYCARGFDLNPVMVLIAKARQLQPEVRASLDSLANDLIEHAAEEPAECGPESDPLIEWFFPTATTSVRSLERAIRSVLVGDGAEVLVMPRTLAHVSSLASFYYVALFRVLRERLTTFRTTNPTWLTTPSSLSDRVRLRHDTLAKSFREQVRHLAGVLRKHNSTIRREEAEIDVGDSRSLPLKDDTVDLVLASPPYCTRIDYAILTRVELATLGLSVDEDLKALRSSLTGSPTIRAAVPIAEESWGPTCLQFLDDVGRHRSKASRTYYSKQFLQYFGDIRCSMSEISRVLRDSGQCVLVVQDSHYKEIHNDLPTIVAEMGAFDGLRVRDQFVFRPESTFRSVNSRATSYKRGWNPCEVVLVLAA